MRATLAIVLLGLHAPNADAQTLVPLPAKNYVVNGGFERGEEGWSHFVHQQGGIDHDVFSAGDASFRMDGIHPDRHFYFWQYNVPLETGKTYTLSARMRSEALAPAALKFGVLLATNHGWTESAALSPPRGHVRLDARQPDLHRLPNRAAPGRSTHLQPGRLLGAWHCRQGLDR